jgi:hypothetical protein
VLRLIRSRRADAYAWFAAMMIFMGLPLASLSIDVVRGMYVRGHLQTATDAACQSAADALDTAHFFATGQARIDLSLAYSQAAREFGSTTSDAGKVQYGDLSLAIDLPDPRIAHCAATANVERLIPLTPVMHVVVESTSEMRVVTGQP